MKFIETDIDGAFVVEPERIVDHRGWFTRLWCERELDAARLLPVVAQVNAGFSHRKGTWRGLHFQVAPYTEVKIVRCTRGAVFDVIVDLRAASPSYGRWFGVELSEANGAAIYVPEGCGQGYLTLEDDSEICYFTSQAYQADAASGVRYDDPAFGIALPEVVTTISPQDESWPDYTSRRERLRFNARESGGSSASEPASRWVAGRGSSPDA